MRKQQGILFIMALAVGTCVHAAGEKKSEPTTPVDTYRAYIEAIATAKTLSELDVYMPERHAKARREAMAKIAAQQQKGRTVSVEEMEKNSLSYMRSSLSSRRIVSIKEAEPPRGRSREGREMSFLVVELEGAKPEEKVTLRPVLELENGKWKVVGNMGEKKPGPPAAKAAPTTGNTPPSTGK